MSSRVRKQSDGVPHKTGPMKATLPMSSVLRTPLNSSSSGSAGSSGNRGTTNSSGAFTALSPPLLRHISPPEYNISGHRSPGALNYAGTPKSSNDSSMRRTASLDAIYQRPSWSRSPGIISRIPNCNAILHLHKATQTDESYLDQQRASKVSADDNDSMHPQQHQHLHLRADTPTEIKIEKVLRQRLQRGSSSGGGATSAGGCQLRGVEHSVSSQTLSPIHAKATPVLIPPRPYPTSTRPTRSSVEGLNQEIEKLVLQPGQPHTCRPETNLFSRGSTPEGHRAPLAEFLHGDMRSVNTQTPNRDLLSSDESQSTSPEDGASSSGTGASPRINRFLAREPPDGCEKVSLKLTDMDQSASGMPTVFKPCIGFLLRPSLGSAFQPIVAMSSSNSGGNFNYANESTDDNQQLLNIIDADVAHGGTDNSQ